MIGEGLLLMVVGMGMVYFFLILVLITIKIIESTCREHTASELALIEEEQRQANERRKSRKDKASQPKDDALVAVISAAISLHRRRFGR